MHSDTNTEKNSDMTTPTNKSGDAGTDMVASTSALSDNDGRDSRRAPSMPFWIMHPGADEQSTIAQAALVGFALASVSGDTAPSWLRAFEGKVKAVRFNIMPVGWIGDWHPSPALQWVVPLSGRWFIETQDGKRVEMGPGAD